MEGEANDQSLAAAFDAACQANPQSVAFVESNGFEVTFERYYYLVHGLAHALEQRVERQQGRATTLGICVPDVVFKTALTLAALRLGFLVQFVTPDQLKKGGALVSVDVVLSTVTAPAYTGRIHQVDGSWLVPPPGPVTERKGGGLISGTSGTTGTPKIQIYSVPVLMARHALIATAHDPREIGPIVIGFSTSTGVGVQSTLQAFLTGQLQVHLSQGMDFVLRTFRGRSAAIGRMPPVALQRFAAFARDFPGQVMTIGTIYCAGGELTEAVAAAAAATFGARIVTSYGSSETSYVAHWEWRPGEAESGIVGPIASQVEWRFAGADGSYNRTSGELCIRVPARLRKTNYLNADGPYDPEGWVRTGDLGHIDAERRLVLTGRRESYLNIGGEKGTAETFERTVVNLGAVLAAGAFAVNDAGGQRLRIVVAPARTFDRERFVAAIGGTNLLRMPLEIAVVKDLPYTESGKVDRSALAGAFQKGTIVFTHH